MPSRSVPRRVTTAPLLRIVPLATRLPEVATEALTASADQSIPLLIACQRYTCLTRQGKHLITPMHSTTESLGNARPTRDNRDRDAKRSTWRHQRSPLHRLSVIAAEALKQSTDAARAIHCHVACQ